MKKIIYLLLFVVLQSCLSVKTDIVNYRAPLKETDQVKIIGPDQDLSGNVEYLGNIKIYDSGFAVKCQYDDVITSALEQSRAMGGNVIKITKHKKPGFLETCHGIKAKVYFEK